MSNKNKGKNGIWKNIDVVKEGIDRTWKEYKTLPPRWKMAIKNRDILDFLHISLNLIGEPLQHMYRLWMYLWIPKWAIIGSAIYTLYITDLWVFK